MGLVKKRCYNSNFTKYSASVHCALSMLRSYSRHLAHTQISNNLFVAGSSMKIFTQSFCRNFVQQVNVVIEYLIKRLATEEYVDYIFGFCQFWGPILGPL